MTLALRRPRDCHFDVFPAIALGTAAGVCLYALYPASGTRFLCEVFQPGYPPSHLPVLTHTDLIPCGPEWWRNCVPSLHTVWAVVCYFALSRQGLGLRAFSLLFMGLTLVATLSRGEHYLGDLVSSFAREHPRLTGTLVVVMVSSTFAAEAWLAADYFRKVRAIDPRFPEVRGVSL